MERPAPDTLPPFTPRIPSPFSRYLEPDGPTYLRYQDEKHLENASRRATIRVKVPRDPYDYLLREQAREEIEALVGAFDERRQAEDIVVWFLRFIVAAAYPERAGDLNALADKLAHCRRDGPVARKPHGGYLVAWEYKCGESRLCPDEARVNALRVARRYAPEIEDFLAEKPTHRAFVAFFTFYNYRPGKLAFAHDDFHKHFLAWLRHATIGKGKHGRPCKIPTFPQIKGALTVMEDPLSADHQWNVHLNVILLVDGRFDFDQAGEVWSEVWGTYANVRFQPVQREGIAGAMAELLKYAAKTIPAEGAGEGTTNPRTNRPTPPAMTEWPPELWLEWWDARHYRRIRGYGRLYAIDGKRWNANDPTQAETTDEARERGQQRIAWLQQAGIKEQADQNEHLLTPWKEIPSTLKPPLRDAIARGEDYIDMDLCEWIGTVSWSFAGYDIAMHGDSKIPPRARRGVNLIPGDKSGATSPGNWHKPPARDGPGLAPGPPG